MQQPNSEMINIIGYTRHIPVMEGINVSFSCNSSHILRGPSSSTCMRNGEWEPDPMEVECRGNDNTILYHNYHDCVFATILTKYLSLIIYLTQV